MDQYHLQKEQCIERFRQAKETTGDWCIHKQKPHTKNFKIPLIIIIRYYWFNKVVLQ